MRSAVRDVGKVMGLSADTISALAGTVWGSYGREITEEHVKEAGFDPRDERLRQTLSIAHELIGFPRHLSQHVGGFVLTETPLHEVVPIQNAAMKDRTVIEWSKDDLDALCILKVDVLALGMLSCLQKAFNLIKQHHRKSYDIHSLPKEDKATYEMMHTADTIGVFQIESRAQMSMLPRLKPKEFYDLVVQVAIVRPGPIQGDMVHPYLKRRQGKEDVTFPGPHPAHGPADELKEVLHKTYGVPLFQEQAMRIAIVAAGFAPEEADQLRRSMASFRNHGTIHKFEEKFITGMTKRGYEEDYAHRCFKQIGGFADYGFPESHAAAFAMLAYASAWIKCHYPHVFTCALLNSQPMGFYAASQLVRDAHEHGVEVRAVDINHSQWDCTLEPAPENVWKYALRLGFRQAKGFRVSDAEKLLAARYRPFDDVEDIHRRARLPVAQLERLAEADCFRSCSLDRRAALWQVRGLADTADLPLFQHAGETERGREAPVSLPEMQLSEHVAHDYQALRLSLKAHPVAFMRDTFTERGVVSNRALEGMPNGSQVAVSGLVLVRQRPGSSKGVVFLTLEDETGVANIVVWGKVFDQYRKDVMGSRLLIVHGKLQHEDNVIHVVARHLENVSMELAKMVDGVETSTLDKERISIQPLETSHHQMQGLIPKSRDFH
jgi:error-prone DNA polymerase